MLHIVVAVLAVNLVQGLMLAWARQFQLASLSSSVNPALLLYVISSLMSQGASWPNITRFEVGFLSLQILTLALSLVSLSGVRVSAWLFWTALVAERPDVAVHGLHGLLLPDLDLSRLPGARGLAILCPQGALTWRTRCIG